MNQGYQPKGPPPEGVRPPPSGTAVQTLYTGMLPFGDGPEIADVDDDLDRRYTPASLARAAVASIVDLLTEPPDLVIEPSVGDGAFVDAFREFWPGVRVFGVDLDPRARGLRKCDEAVVADWETFCAQLPAHWKGARLVGGNPPFSVALRHVRVTRDELPEAVTPLIMPLAYLGVQEWQPLLARDPVRRLRAVNGRPWQKNVRETAVYTWDKRGRVVERTELVLPAIDW